MRNSVLRGEGGRQKYVPTAAIQEVMSSALMRAFRLWWVTGDCRGGDVIGPYACGYEQVPLSAALTIIQKPTILDLAILSVSATLWNLAVVYFLYNIGRLLFKEDYYLQTMLG